ncbi:hypothetical protein PHYBLDRAFT_170068 [Phycomyces blakesleeanus NRRL 1555(-)]|uniref:Uncharacterized protein n=1 Tax=Phycomyces blakesleeanus (strain ATCC 8743b / DSM 1359 / FGSC 10004 / NBRC 33097 / NRRL 1555) TaxID=763407 RepID=A0A163DLN5_PHYB8|nr:hypothetical protein PHYBLDRAFT_170068 [Phycomyces blakesleeanus NRRL 1555(-)]OAD72170.1 hypothetical protein PHYBLDRAFT_170068 [Phycomyces blakesleeanus NRRL 1555(-)]|eukprot:XP_018290210.1 hypothetical protein PHYBLDRAFT_170068 [Phycomyces blakesleeanus NRRL 1555(-)]
MLKAKWKCMREMVLVCVTLDRKLKKKSLNKEEKRKRKRSFDKAVLFALQEQHLPKKKAFLITDLYDVASVALTDPRSMETGFLISPTLPNQLRESWNTLHLKFPYRQNNYQQHHQPWQRISTILHQMG